MRLAVLLLLLPVLAQGQISFVAGSHSDNTAASITPTEPTGCEEGDIVIAFGKWRDLSAAYTITDPADFIEIDQFSESTGSAADTLYVGYKIRGSDAGSGYQFSTGTSDSVQMNLVCFRDINTDTPFDVTYVKGNHYKVDNNSPNAAAAPITTSTDGAMVVLLYMSTQAHSSTSGGPPDNYTEGLSAALTQPVDGAYMAYRTIATAGTETPGVFTHTDTNGTNDPRKFTLALRPAGEQASGLLLRRRRN